LAAGDGDGAGFAVGEGATDVAEDVGLGAGEAAGVVGLAVGDGAIAVWVQPQPQTRIDTSKTRLVTMAILFMSHPPYDYFRAIFAIF
jgi:hypothetical protein